METTNTPLSVELSTNSPSTNQRGFCILQA